MFISVYEITAISSLSSKLLFDVRIRQTGVLQEIKRILACMSIAAKMQIYCVTFDLYRAFSQNCQSKDISTAAI